MGHGDTESVNLGTGERAERVSGNGESRLESLIPGLKPVDPADLAEYIEAVRESPPRRGGLILPPDPGCIHDWQPFELLTSWANFQASVFVSKCSKCHVLGMPPKKG